MKYHKVTDLSKLDKELIKLFCDTPGCPSCGIMFLDNKFIFLGAWGERDNPQVVYRLCDACGNSVPNISYFELLHMERRIENYIKILHPNIIERFAENVRKKPIVSRRF